ncbi:AN1-type zinc finger protein 1 [Allomyces arbusculus]|nr:AN1-type zinc finger protein 1 [Allomyces arbusculus]
MSPDFLPIQCTHCRQPFCKDHVQPDDHACAALPAPVIATGTINTQAKVQCGVATCATADVRLVVPCAQCQGQFCLAHRHADQHACVSVVGESDPNAKARALLKKHFPSSASSNAAALVTAATTSSTTTRPAPKKKMPILELMKLKQKAQGDAKTPPAQRSYHAVHLPGGTIAVRYFPKSVSVGRVLDTVFALTGMDWKSTVTTHDMMLCVEDVRLPTNAVWSEVVGDGATVLLNVVPKSNAS